MKKRHIKKLDKKLYRVVKELNEDVMKDLKIPGEMPHEDVMIAFDRIRNHPHKVNQALTHYRKYIVNKR